MITPLLEHGPQLLAGVTLLLAAGSLAVRLSRRPLHAQRRGELCLLAVLVFVPAALIPLPRHGRDALEWAGEHLARFTGALAGLAAPAAPDAPDALPARRDVRALPLRERAVGEVRPLPTDAPGLASDATGTALPGGAPRSPDTARLPPASAPGLATDSASVITPDSARGLAPELAPAGASRVPPVPPASAPVDAAGPARAAGSPVGAGTGAHGAPSLARGVAWLYLAGAAASLAWLLAGLLRLRRVLARTRPAPAWLANWVASAADGLRLRVLVGPDARSPFCVGLLRQTIVLPPALLHGGRRGLQPVLLHELAHARHGDGRGRLLAALALPLLWYHPLYWWLRRRVRLASELLADDRAAADDRPAYARELLDLVQRLPHTPALPAGARPVFGAPHEFTRRIEMLLSRRDRLDTRCSTLARGVHSLFLIALLSLGASLFGATPAPAAADDAADQVELQQLRAERTELKAQLAQMRAELDALRTHTASLMAAFEQRAAEQQAGAGAGAREVQAQHELALEAHERRAVEERHAREASEAHAAGQEYARELARAAEERARAEREIARAAEEQARVRAEVALEQAAREQRLAEARVAAELERAAADEDLARLELARRRAELEAVLASRDRAATDVPRFKDPYAPRRGADTPDAPSAPDTPDAVDEPAPRAQPSQVPASAMTPRHPAPPAAPRPAAEPAPAPSPEPAPRPAPVPQPAPAPAPQPAPVTPLAPAQLAPLDLLSQLIDIEAQRELVQRRLELTVKLAERDHASEAELHATKLELHALERKHELVERLLDARASSLEGAVKLARLRTERAAQQLEGGVGDELAVLEARQELDALQTQLELLEELR